MTKTQPLLTVPESRMQSAPVVVTGSTEPKATTILDAVPLPVAWTIFGISAVTLLIQIWNYFAT
ncbi:MAG: hypothetical protein ABR589_12870 [Chthoniobacterales bacterium]